MVSYEMSNGQSSSYSPFTRLSEVELRSRVRDLWQRLEGRISLGELMRGALLAQSNDKLHFPPSSVRLTYQSPIGPDSFEVLERDLTETEKTMTSKECEAIQREERAKWSCITKDLWIILFTCAVGAIVQGWCQENIVGANLQWPSEIDNAERVIGNPDWCHSIGYDEAQIQHFGLVNAIPYFAASVLGPLVSDPVADITGRRPALALSALFSLAGAIGAAYSQTWYQLFVCRMLQGLGMGAKSSIIPIMESEVSPPKLRSRLLVSWQTFVATGILFGATANWSFSNSWRLQIGISAVPAITLLLLCLVIPEYKTPHWHVKNHDFFQAFRVLRRIKETDLQAARDLFRLYDQVSPELPRLGPQDQIPSPSKSARYSRFWRKYPDLIRKQRNLNALVAVSVVMSAQQFSGFNIFAFLSADVIQPDCIEDARNLEFTFGRFALANVVASGLTVFFIKWFSRRALLLLSLGCMMPLLIATSAVLHPEKTSTSVLVIILLLNTFFYSFGAGVIPFMYSSEVFPLYSRETGMAFACFVNFSLAGALAMTASTTVVGKQAITTEITLLKIFAGLDAVAFVLVWFLMRSPDKDEPLENMDGYFEGPVFAHPKFQLNRACMWIRLRGYQALGKNGSEELRERVQESFPEWCEKRDIEEI